MPTTDLILRVQPGTDVLHRVVSVCRRRNLQILALSYAEQQITLTVVGDQRQTCGIVRWLSALLHVFEVSDGEFAAAGDATPAQ
jgi:hypothetical protein